MLKNPYKYLLNCDIRFPSFLSSGGPNYAAFPVQCIIDYIMDSDERSPDHLIVAFDSIVLFWINHGWSEYKSGITGQLIQYFFKMQMIAANFILAYTGRVFFMVGFQRLFYRWTRIFVIYFESIRQFARLDLKNFICESGT